MQNIDCHSECGPVVYGSAGELQCGLLSVKEAASRLGLSKSAVYRIKRTDGPFQFVINGRRIYIVSSSLEAHLNNRAAHDADLGSCSDDNLLKASVVELPKPTGPKPDYVKPEVSEPVWPIALRPTMNMNGQREFSCLWRY